MKKLLFILFISLTICITGCSNNNNLNSEIYTIKKDEVLEVGKDLPSGSYILKTESSSIGISINKKDGSSLVSEILFNDKEDEPIEYDIKLPQDTTITVTEDSELIGK